MYCKICGDYSGQYPLCKDCYYTVQNSDYEFDFDDDYESTTTCIACQEEKDDDGYLFCKSCYYKYKNKTLVFQVNKCVEFKLIYNYYEGKYKCIDGHMVKSKAEREIDNFFFRHNIKHCYEPTLPIDEIEEHDLHPDFYLPEMKVYIEHWGKENDEQYNRIKAYKVDIYRKLQITLICTHESTDSADIEGALRRKLKNFKVGEINYL